MLSAQERVARYRQRQKAAGWRTIQFWVPDTRSPELVAACRQQMRNVQDSPIQDAGSGDSKTLRDWARGSVVRIASAKDAEKPDPAQWAIVVQSQLFTGHATVTVCPITANLQDAPLFCLPIAPSAGNGLSKSSQIRVDQITTVAAERIAAVMGQCEMTYLRALDRALALWLGWT